MDKFWDLYLKATIFENIEFKEQRQQYCARLPKDVRAYIMDQKPNTISKVIHRSIIAMKIFSAGWASPPHVDKSNKNQQKDQSNKDCQRNGKKKKEKTEYKGTNRLAPKELEHYQKEN